MFAFPVEGLPHRSQTGAPKCATELPKITVAGPTIMVFRVFLFFNFCFFVFVVVWLFSGCLLRDALEIGHPKALKLLPKHSQLAQRAPEISRGASTEHPKAQTRSSSLLRPSLSLSLSPSNPLFASSLSPLLPSSLLSSPLLASFPPFSLRFVPQALPEDTARRTARERLNKVNKGK